MILSHHHPYDGYRHGPDLFKRSIRWLGFAGWSMLALAILFLNEGGSEKTTALHRVHFGFMDAVQSSHLYLSLAAIGLVIGVTGTTLDLMRNHRRSDHLHPFFMILSILAFLVFMLF